MKEIKNTKWIPDWGIKRISGMVQNRPDWCISRQRIWGLRIPLEDSKDIMDVWLESGASWATLLGQKQADLYLEGSDQHRGWFQSSLLLSVAANDQAPYKAVLTHGFTVDEQGRKMSKSMGNVVDPLKVIAQYGADIMRLWVISSQFKDDMSISDKLLKQVSDVYGKIRNTWRFLISNLYDFERASLGVIPAKAGIQGPVGVEMDSRLRGNDNSITLTELDKWILMRLQKLVADCEKSYEEYEYHKIYHDVHDFCANDLSSFYLDMIKDRLYCDGKTSATRRSSQYAMSVILKKLLRIMAPVLSFTTEEVWQFLTPNPTPPILGGETDKSKVSVDFSLRSASVHLQEFPVVDPALLDEALEKRWEEIFSIRTSVYQKIEELRQAKTVAGSLDAKVELTLSKDLGLSKEDWQLILIVSQVELKNGKELLIKAAHADGEKCERCWKWEKLENGLCPRCAKVIKEQGK
jgi:isoleucyl-tRNA synthetase